MNSSKKNNPIADALVCGIDEAGRGPVLGPLVLCGLCIKESALKSLLDMGIKDSKKLTLKKRTMVAEQLKSQQISYKIITVSPKEIDERGKKKITLNRLEELKMAEIINTLKPDIIFIDAADVKEDRFGDSILKLLNYKPKQLISKHKADDTYPIVSAASILAKDKRDKIIDVYKKEYGEIGSGYPSDKKTTDFLRDWIQKHKKAPPIARNSWQTTQKILEQEVRNKKITDFLD
ncbi:MAG: ribonuclease HII [Promethearchaeota archaeon]